MPLLAQTMNFRPGSMDDDPDGACHLSATTPTTAHACASGARGQGRAWATARASNCTGAPSLGRGRAR
eukprot:7842578-Alexandrium_andersonii.AAC.1